MQRPPVPQSNNICNKTSKKNTKIRHNNNGKTVFNEQQLLKKLKELTWQHDFLIQKL